MDVLEGQIFYFSDVEVDTGRGCLRRAGGEYHLRQKSFQVLVYLLENPDRLITKDELIETVWRETAVTDGVLVQCIKEIRRTLGDDHHLPRYIKTVPKAGYRFIGTISDLPALASGFSQASTHIHTEEITRIEVEYESDDFIPAVAIKPLAALTAGRPKSRVFAFAVLVVVFAAVAFSLFYFSKFVRRDQETAAKVVLPNTPGKRSLAVMYFTNQSGNSELNWLREGLADMLITDLSRSQKLNILSRQQFHTLLDRNGYAGDQELSPENALDITRKSGAEAFITGSFARIGEAIRLDVKLYDTETGDLRAVESVTAKKVDEIFADIDLLALKLANHLVATPFEQEKQSDITQVMTGNLEAYRYYSLAVAEAEGLHNKEAIALLEKAIALDPQFAMAHARIGYAYAITWGLAAKAKPYLEKAFSLSNRLTEKDRLNIAAWYSIANLDYPNAIEFYRQIISKYPAETEAYYRLGNLLNGEEQFDEAETVLKQGLAIDSGEPLLYNALGSLYSTSGRHEEAIAMHRRYLALAPNEANSHDSLGMSYQWAGFYAEAMGEFRRALELKPNFEVAIIHLANTHFQTGRYGEAIELYKQYIAVAPSENERARGYSSIAQVYRRMKKYDLATKMARLAIKEKDFYVGEMWLIALEQGDKAAAGRLEEKLFAEPTGTNRGRRTFSRFRFCFRGMLALENDRQADALENFKEAMRHPPPIYEQDALEDCLAVAYLRFGQFDEAVIEFERILSLNPNYPLARFHLAQAYEGKGQIDQARENYRLFLNAWKNADADIPEVVTAAKSLKDS